MFRPLTTLALAAVLLACAGPSFAQTVPPNTKEEVDKLIAVLKSDAPQKEKVDACRGLAVIGTKDAVPALAALLSDEQLSHMARYALEPIPDPSVDRALRGAAGKLKGRLLVGVVGSLGVRRDAAAVPLLVPMLKDRDADVARTAARSLGKIASPEAAKALGEVLATAPEPVRPAVGEGCLACAEALLAEDKRDEAAAMYERVGKAELPKHFRVAAVQGLILARQPDEKP